MTEIVTSAIAGDGSALAAKDLRITMPPNPFCFERLEAIAPLLERALGEEHRD